MIDAFSPAFIFFIAAILLPLIPSGALRATVMLLVPIASGWFIWNAPTGLHEQVQFFSFTLTLMHVDKLSTIFGLIFSVAAFLTAIYAWKVHDRVQQVATLFYAGSAIGAVFAGDLISLFFFWEGTAIASVFLDRKSVV